MSESVSTAPNLPLFVVEEHRYTQPEDGWVFTMLTPAPDYMGSEEPFGSFNEVTYHRNVDGWMRTPHAVDVRAKLTREGFTMVSWETVPEEVFSYVRFYLAPIEWQSDPAFIKEMTVMWLKGEWPTLPEVATPEPITPETAPEKVAEVSLVAYQRVERVFTAQGWECRYNRLFSDGSTDLQWYREGSKDHEELLEDFYARNIVQEYVSDPWPPAGAEELIKQQAASRERMSRNGQCLSCGAIETILNKVTGYKDFSGIGESERYPVGYGCELCD